MYKVINKHNLRERLRTLHEQYPFTVSIGIILNIRFKTVFVKLLFLLCHRLPELIRFLRIYTLEKLTFYLLFMHTASIKVGRCPIYITGCLQSITYSNRMLSLTTSAGNLKRSQSVDSLLINKSITFVLRNLIYLSKRFIGQLQRRNNFIFILFILRSRFLFVRFALFINGELRNRGSCKTIR